MVLLLPAGAETALSGAAKRTGPVIGWGLLAFFGLRQGLADRASFVAGQTILWSLLLTSALVLMVSGVATTTTVIIWSLLSCGATLLWWSVVYLTVGENPLYALLYPIGALLLLYIFFTAVVRGRRVSWKGRTYIAQ